jgi:hypothetical protein
VKLSIFTKDSATATTPTRWSMPTSSSRKF